MMTEHNNRPSSRYSASLHDAAAAGALVPLIDFLLSSRGVDTASARAALQLLLDIRREQGSRWPHEELEAIAQLQSTTISDPAVRAAADATVSSLKEISDLPAPVQRVGCVNILLCANRRLREAFGTVWPLDAEIIPWGEARPPEPRDVDDPASVPDVVTAAQVAFAAVIREHSSPRLSATGSRALRYLAFENNFRNLRVSVEGESLGLGLAIALFSSLLRRPVPANCGFTGRVNSRGTILSVGGLPEKLAAASHKGLTKVYVPRDNLELPSPPPGVEIFPVSNLRDALSDCLGDDVLAAAVSTLGSYASPIARQRYEEMRRDSSIPVVFVAFVGDQDPKSRPAPDGTTEDGNILAAAEHVRANLRLSVLLHTTEPARRPNEPSFADRASDTKTEILARGLSDVRVMPLPDVEQTDIQSCYDHLRQVVVQVASELKDQPWASNVEWVYGVGGGTPQMKMAAHLLADRRLPVDPFLLYVRPTRDVKSGQQRVELVELPLLE